MTKTGLNPGSVAAHGGSFYLWGWNEVLSRIGKGCVRVCEK